jgi:nucleoside-diphosphate-sugar epimerase
MSSYVSRRGVALVTGAGGFIGKYVVDALVANGFLVNIASRTEDAVATQSSGVRANILVGSIDGDTDWTVALRDCDAVVHLAGRAHRVHEPIDVGAAEFQIVNVDATINLAQQAWKAGVRRFVYISSVGVMGEPMTTPFVETDLPRPISEYAKSKLRAESALQQLAKKMGGELVILRPCLVYGPGNPGNMERLLRLVAMGLPLPFASISNSRSLVSVQYLSHVITKAVSVPICDDGVYLVSDGVDVSTLQIITAFANGLEVRPIIYKCPLWVLNGVSILLGRRTEFQKVVGSHNVDSSKMRRSFGILPNMKVMEQLTVVGVWFRKHLKASRKW